LTYFEDGFICGALLVLHELAALLVYFGGALFVVLLEKLDVFGEIH
jgi:hypothetical protein